MEMTWTNAQSIVEDSKYQILESLIEGAEIHITDDEANEIYDMIVEAMGLATHFAVRLGKDAEGPVGDWIHEVHEAALTIAKVTRVAGHEPWGDEDV